MSPRSEQTRKPMTLAEVKQLLEGVEPEKADQMQKRALDYVLKFSKTSAEEARAARERLVRECGLTEEEACGVINILPATVEELRVFASGWRKLVPTEVLERMLAILKEAA